jgi:hypothetical protein
MRALQRFFDSPATELVVGVVLLAAGLLELRDIVLVKLPARGPLLPPAAAVIGAALVLRSLPGMFLGLEIADTGIRGLAARPVLLAVDRLAHCHLADLAMGVILIVAATADLIDVIASGRVLPICNTASGTIAFGLVPFGNTFLAYYRGVGRIDREHPARLLDRAEHNPWLRELAGILLLGGGGAEFGAVLAGDHAFGHSLALPGGLAVTGLFAVLSGLPGIYLGFKALAGTRSKTG